MSAISGADPYAYRYRVEGKSRKRAEVIVRVHDAGQLGNLRREVAERLAWNYGVRGRRFEEDVYFSRQGGRHTGDERRVARHALRVEGDALKVARFAADLPGVLAAVEHAATAMMRTVGRWVRDSAHGQRWTDIHDANHQRVERRYWRRSYIRHLAEWIGPEAPTIGDVPMPDWSENWLCLQARIAQATAGTVDVVGARGHMAEALLFAQAAHVEPRPVEPLPEPRTRYATVHEAIHAPVERNDEIGDVEFCYGDPAELPRAAARDEAAAVVEEERGDEDRDQDPQQHAALNAGPYRPEQAAAPGIVLRRFRPYGSIRTSRRPHRRRPPHRRPPTYGANAAPAATTSPLTPKATTQR
ncbi:hypothetical protein [Streptomyces platensis]|uniref:hypothetical protein n=1 Tax=Streptomyces platensis TaxID=58346 RepID=UPI00331F5DBD